MKRRHLLVYYELRIGEDENCSHTVIDLNKGTKPKDAVHKYFLNFYPHSKAEDVKKAEYYYYGDVPCAVKVSHWKFLTEAQYKVLSELSLLWC